MIVEARYYVKEKRISIITDDKYSCHGHTYYDVSQVLFDSGWLSFLAIEETELSEGETVKELVEVCQSVDRFETHTGEIGDTNEC